MATTTLTPKQSDRRFYAVVALLMFVIAIITLSQPAVAQAAPTFTVGSGTAITPASGGGCNIALALGDEALTAGHCGGVGDTFIAKGRTIGTVIKSQQPTPHVGPNALDYAVIKLAPGVTAQNTIVRLRGITAPYVGMHVRKYGQGVANQGTRYGYVQAVTPNGIVANIPTAPFDSGAPIVDDNNNLVAVVSGMTDPLEDVLGVIGIPEHGNVVGTRADKISSLTGIRF